MAQSELMEKVDESKLGTCDKKQYEHCGPHEQIYEVFQSMPPFPCVNWKPLTFDTRAEDKHDS
jgi:hypothetical protein